MEGKEQEIESESEPDVDLKRPAGRGDIEIQQCDEDVPCFPFHLSGIPPHKTVACDVEGIMWQYDAGDDEWYKIEDVDDDDGPCLESGKPFSEHPEDNTCFS